MCKRISQRFLQIISKEICRVLDHACPTTDFEPRTGQAERIRELKDYPLEHSRITLVPDESWRLIAVGSHNYDHSWIRTTVGPGSLVCSTKQLKAHSMPAAWKIPSVSTVPTKCLGVYQRLNGADQLPWRLSTSQRCRPIALASISVSTVPTKCLGV